MRRCGGQAPLTLDLEVRVSSPAKRKKLCPTLSLFTQALVVQMLDNAI